MSSGSSVESTFRVRRSKSATGAIFLAATFLGTASSERAAANDAKLVAYGRHLSGECSACHRIDGADTGIPSITGWDPEEFATTLGFYRKGDRNNPAMVSVAQSLDDDQIKALAAYFGSLPNPTNRHRRK
jgi:cytochrome c553